MEPLPGRFSSITTIKVLFLFLSSAIFSPSFYLLPPLLLAFFLLFLLLCVSIRKQLIHVTWQAILMNIYERCGYGPQASLNLVGKLAKIEIEIHRYWSIIDKAVFLQMVNPSSILEP